MYLFWECLSVTLGSHCFSLDAVLLLAHSQTALLCIRLPSSWTVGLQHGDGEGCPGGGHHHPSDLSQVGGLTLLLFS